MAPTCPEISLSSFESTSLATSGLCQDQTSPPPPLQRRSLIETAVSQVFGVRQLDLRGISRGRARIALARQVAMYLAHVALGLTLSETGKLFTRDRTTVAHACSVVEDMRDDPVFDRIVQLLEGVVTALVQPREFSHLLS